MDYITRELERKFLQMNQAFKAVMVTGARQVGKSTMLKHLAENEKRAYVTMDNARDRELANTDPALFFQMYRPPVLIDEVQKAPGIFEKIKEMCDETEETGLFWLTGSESEKMLKSARESLAGRVCILRMYSLSQREKQGLSGEGLMDLSFSGLREREKKFPANDINRVYQHIWEGGMPGTVGMDAEQRQAFYESYIDTYLMRDAVDDNGIANTEGFRRALRACAAFTGNLVNYSDIAAAAGISSKTAKEWVQILCNMGVIFLLEPYSGNELKRMVKRPKLYFCDTGLCAYLSLWTSRDTLMMGAASGHFYENYVIGEFLRTVSASSEKINMSFYRDSNQKEIDLILEENGNLHPIEIKRAAMPERKLVKAFNVLKSGRGQLSSGGIVCMAERVYPIDQNNCFIPSNLI